MNTNSNLPRTALIVGATGLVGESLLHILLKDATYTQITALVRKKLPENEQNNLVINNPKFTQIEINFDAIEKYKEVIKATDVFCCLGTTIAVAGSKENFRKVDFDYPLEIAKIAKFNGTDTFSIVTAMGADASSSVFYNQVKGEIEDSIAKLSFKSYNVFRPSLLLGDRKTFRFGESIGKFFAKGLSFLMTGGLKKYRAIQADAVAFAMFNLTKLAHEGINVYESNRLQEVFELGIRN